MASIEKEAPVPAPTTSPAPRSSSSERKDLTASEKRYDIDIESQDDHVGKLQGGTTDHVNPGSGDVEDEVARKITLRQIWEETSWLLFYRKFRRYFHLAYFVSMTALVAQVSCVIY